MAQKKIHLDTNGAETACAMSIEKAVRWHGIAQVVEVTTDPYAVTCVRPGCAGAAARADYVMRSTEERHAVTIATSLARAEA